MKKLSLVFVFLFAYNVYAQSELDSGPTVDPCPSCEEFSTIAVCACFPPQDRLVFNDLKKQVPGSETNSEDEFATKEKAQEWCDKLDSEHAASCRTDLMSEILINVRGACKGSEKIQSNCGFGPPECQAIDTKGAPSQSNFVVGSNCEIDEVVGSFPTMFRAHHRPTECSFTGKIDVLCGAD